MPEFVAVSPNVEALGQTVLAVVDGMGAFRNLALEILKRHGEDNPKPDGWYRQQPWLDAFKEIFERVGKSTLNLIGQKTPENAKFPPKIDSIDKLERNQHAAHDLHSRGMRELLGVVRIRKHLNQKCCNRAQTAPHILPPQSSPLKRVGQTRADRRRHPGHGGFTFTFCAQLTSHPALSARFAKRRF